MNKLRPHLNKLLLALIFLALSLSTVIWTLKDSVSPVWDPADHISAGYDYYRALANLDFNGFLQELFVKRHYYAPLVHLVTAIIFLIFGASRLAGIGINLISLAVMLVTIPWIGRMLYGRILHRLSDQSLEGARNQDSLFTLGVVAALIATCYHFMAVLLHDAFLDYPLTAIVTASFGLLIRAGDFKVRRDSLMFGIAAGLGMLTKQTFGFFFILPVIYVTVRVLRSRDRKAIVNLLLAGLVALFITGIWYGPHISDVIYIYKVNRAAAISENEPLLFTWKSNLFCLHALLSTQIQLPFGMLFVGGLLYSLVRRRKESLLLYLWILSGIATFTLIANKDPRYTVPSLPAVALISVCWLGDFNAQAKWAVALKRSLVAIIVAWAMVSFVNAQWPRAGAGTYINTPYFRWCVFSRNYLGIDHRPQTSDWSLLDIVKTVKSYPPGDQLAFATVGGDPSIPLRMAERPPIPEETVPLTTDEPDLINGSKGPILGVVVNLPHLNPSAVALYARLLVPEPADPPLLRVRWLVVDAARDRVERCDYLLVRNGLDKADYVAPIEWYVDELIHSNPSRFTRMTSFPIPLEQAEAVIYKTGGLIVTTDDSK